MKVLITHVSAGAGHRKAAEALYEYLRENRPDLELKLIDILDYTNPIFKFLYSSVYIFVISKLPYVWYFFYRFSFYFSDNILRYMIDYLNCLSFAALLKREKPDFVLSTHFLASSVITIFKKKASFNLKLISVITDYNLHPFWVGEGVDIYIASCDNLRQDLMKRGVETRKIRTYGIPAQPKFYQLSDRKVIAEKLGVLPSEFTILIMTGAIGIGPIEQIIESLAGSVQFLVVCGSNKRLFQRLTDLGLKMLKVYPLVDNVDELMSVSDVVLTKAGGLTITESLVKSLPMVFFANIPGLETANADIIVSLGAGFRAETVKIIREAIFSLKDEPTVYEKVLENIRRLRRSDTLINISSAISS